MLGESVDVRKFVDETGGDEDSAGEHRVTAGECEAEAVVAASRDIDDASVEHFGAVAADLLACDRVEVRWRDAVVTQVAVHVGSRSVAWLAGVDDDHRSSLPAEL